MVVVAQVSSKLVPRTSCLEQQPCHVWNCTNDMGLCKADVAAPMVHETPEMGWNPFVRYFWGFQYIFPLEGFEPRFTLRTVQWMPAGHLGNTKMSAQLMFFDKFDTT